MGGGKFRGRGQQQGGGFGWGRGQVILYNYEHPRNFSRDCQSPVKTCTYCKAFDHTIEQCPQLIVKWLARIVINPNPVQNQNPNPNNNIHTNSIEPREPHIFVVTRGGVATGVDHNTQHG